MSMTEKTEKTDQNNPDTSAVPDEHDLRNLDTVTQELANPISTTPILAGWLGTRTLCLPKVLPVETLKLAQFFYYAGALHATAKIMEALDGDDPVAQLDEVNTVIDELQRVREHIADEMRERGQEVWGITPAGPITPEFGADAEHVDHFAKPGDM